MMPGTPGGGTSVLLALLVCLFLGAVVYLELSTSIAPEVASNSPTEDGATQVERPSLPPETAYEPPPFEAFAEASARPIFAPSRRPPSNAPAVTTAAAPQVIAFGFELVGVLISADERMALVRQDGVTDLQRVAIGRSLNGWRIDQIEPDHVVFSADETVRRVELRADEPPKVETARDRRLRERAERRQEQEREQAERRSAPDRDLSDTQPENMSAE